MQKWNYETCKKEAAKYRTKSEFAKGSPGAYEHSRRHSYWEEITAHMKVLWSEKWSYDTVKEAAKEFENISLFRAAHPGAYDRIVREGWWELVDHIKRRRKQWESIEEVKAEASQYSSRTMFAQESGWAYKRAIEKDWLDEVCGHMEIQYNGYLHCTYSIINSRLGLAYAGVTSQAFEARMAQHRDHSNVTRSKVIANLKDTVYTQESDYVYTPRDVKEFAESDLAKALKERGYKLLNDKSSIGSVGYSKRKWTKKACLEIALGYSTRWEFQKNEPNAQAAAKRYGWMEEVCAHMETIRTSWSK